MHLNNLEILAMVGLGLYEYEVLKVNHRPIKFGVPRNFGSEDRKVLVCCVISQDLMNKGHVTF